MSKSQVPSKKLTFAILIVGLILWGAWIAVGIPSKLGSPYLVVLLFLCLVLSRQYKKWGPRWAKLTLLWIFLGGAILAADFGLRIFAWNLFHPLPQSRWFREWNENSDLHRYVPLQKFVGDTYGDLAAMTGEPFYRKVRNIYFETDEWGFLNPPGSKDQELDLIVLGDSYAAGLTSDRSKTWVESLRLKRGYSLYNLSVPSGPSQQLLTLKYTLPQLKLKPGAILLWTLFEGNDLDDKYLDYFDPKDPPGGYEKFKLSWDGFRGRSPVRMLARRFKHRENSDVAWSRSIQKSRGFYFLYFKPYFERTLLTEAEVHKHFNWDSFHRVFQEMQEFASSKNLRLIILTFPSKESIYRSFLSPESKTPPQFGFIKAVEKLSRDAKVQFLNPTSLLLWEAKNKWANQKELFWWRDDSHFNHQGEAWMAEFISKEFKKLGISPHP